MQPRDELAQGRTLSDALFRLVRPEPLYERSIAERHRIVFYVGHVDAFDWNLLRGPLELPAFHETLDRLFAFGIDPTDGDVPRDLASDWPARSEIDAYVARARATLDSALAARAVDPTLIQVAIEHRLMHAETLAYLFGRLPLEALTSTTAPAVSDRPAPLPRPVRIPAGFATLGARQGSGLFGWDNEFEATQVDVPTFLIASLPVTNGAWLAFVEAGGPPASFWVRRGDRWRQRTVLAEVPLPLDWPVWVSHEAASAYAKWAGGVLPTEAQWHRAAYGAVDGERLHPWGDSAPAEAHGNFDFRRWEPTPVDGHPAGASAFGVQDLVGNGWEWTSTPFAPLPGFSPMPFYPGYSADFFDGNHFVMKGAGPRTAARLVRRSFRNWFQPRYPHVHAKFRLVR